MERSKTDAAATGYARVLLPLRGGGPYDYRIPAGLALQPGCYVEVPFRSRLVIGVVWSLPQTTTVAASRLRTVTAALAMPALPAAHRAFIDCMAAYCMIAPGAALRMALPIAAALQPAPVPMLWVRGGDAPTANARLTAARRRTLATLGAQALPTAALAQQAKVSVATLRGLERCGLLQRRAAPEARLPTPDRTPDPERRGVSLSVTQQAAATALTAAVARGGFSVTVLDGVTGSGKTEVYFEAIAEALRHGGQTLALLPEIALSAQWLTRFEQRFGAPPALWHSGLGEARRRAVWRAAANGSAAVVVGARSALHLPLPKLALILVDEEHDAGFRQEDGLLYHARDMAVLRGQTTGCPVALISATPSLETMVNVARGRYRTQRLPRRHGAPPPTARLIDIRAYPPPRGRWITAPLEQALRQTLAAGRQALLFLNRRGYAPLTLCGNCGHRFACPQCSAWLVAHQTPPRLVCHHCGIGQPIPAACPACKAVGVLRACGPGVERLTEETAALFPEARLEIATSDTLNGPDAVAAFVRRVESGVVDIILGTQSIAKGHHFPALTLAAAVDADMGLCGGDLRAAERAWQLLHQMAGRAGRGQDPGQALIQTADPESPLMQSLAASDRDGFLAAEAAARQLLAAPPFGRWAALILSGIDAAAVAAAATALARCAPHSAEVRVLGPAPAPLALLRGRHRVRLLLQAGATTRVQPLLRDWLAAAPAPRSVRVQVDIDPYTFL